MDIVFIVGAGHSGSTLLNIILGAFPKAISIGEIDKIIHPETRGLYMERYIFRGKYPCSCGKMPGECPFWGEFTDYIKHNGDKPYQDVYAKATEIAEQKFKATHLIDASKNVHALRRLTKALSSSHQPTRKENLKVIHLVKDARNYAASNIRSDRINGVLKSFYKWLGQNTRIENFLKEQNISYINIGYEELAISTPLVVQKIAAFLGVAPIDVNKKLHPKESHILFGNNMRLDDKKSARIQYDYHWFTSFKIPAWYLLYPGLHQKNMRWCYSNIQEKFKKMGKI